MVGSDDEGLNPYRGKTPSKKNNGEVTTLNAYKLGCKFCPYLGYRYNWFICTHPDSVRDYPIRWLSHREEPRKVPKACPLREEEKEKN